MALHRLASHSLIALHRLALFFLALSNFVSPCIVLHCIVLHNPTSPRIALLCIALHFIFATFHFTFNRTVMHRLVCIAFPPAITLNRLVYHHIACIALLNLAHPPSPSPTQTSVTLDSYSASATPSLFDISPSGRKSVAFRLTSAEDGGKTHVEITTRAADTSSSSDEDDESCFGEESFRVDVSASHGKVHTSLQFGGVSWSHDERFVAYVAQVK
jgi:hypothetical protein